MKKVLSLFTLAFVLFTCESEIDMGIGDSDYLIFGSYAGECIGDCISAFRVSDLKLEEDITARYYERGYQFIPGRTLERDALTKAKRLLDQFPTTLITSETDRYGCPDCADQGAIFLTFNNGGEERTIILDTRDTEDQSADVIRYKDEVFEVIKDLRE